MASCLKVIRGQIMDVTSNKFSLGLIHYLPIALLPTWSLNPNPKKTDEIQEHFAFVVLQRNGGLSV